MQFFFLGIGLLVIFVLAGRWFVSVEPRQAAAAIKWAGLGLLAFVILLIVVSGRLSLLLPLVALLLWLRRRYQRARPSFGFSSQPSSGGSSEVRTRFLHMSLDHDSGQMDGEIVDGRHAGQRLSQLDLAALLELLRDYRIADEQSASVLEAYLDRVGPEDWRDSGDQAQDSTGEGRARHDRGPNAPTGPMTRAEALEILGLEEGAGNDEVRDAHRRLMQKLHPDHGGSNYLAAKLNEAKDLLIGR
jgi:hypothetical protein